MSFARLSTLSRAGSPGDEAELDVAADVLELQALPAAQQPSWTNPALVQRMRADLATRPPLVRPADIRALRSLLRLVAEGRAQVIQAGDCAEDPAECTAEHVHRKTAVLDLLAGAMKLSTNKPVLRVGRIAGQYAKPRSQPFETVGGRELPVFRGHLINAPEADVQARRANPARLLTGYEAAADVMTHLGWRGTADDTQLIDPPVWTSHEALVLDYELPQLRTEDTGRLVLTSTHWPWIGDRTRQVDGAHVALLSRIANPVACKVGPSMTAGELVAICERLDPDRAPGRLTLIARMGAGVLPDRLGTLAGAVRAAGHPVIWLIDPMHGNTVTASDGRKTRYLSSIRQELREFLTEIREAGGVPGGIHLETTVNDVDECLDSGAAPLTGDRRFTSFCDPRLTAGQAVGLLSAWQ